MIHDKRRRHVLWVFLLMILAGTACGESPQKIESGMENSGMEMASDDLESGENRDANDFKEPGTSVMDQADENTDDDMNELTVTQGQYVYRDRYNDIEIYYPQIQDFIDPDKAERINALIENDVKKLIVDEQVFDYIFCVELNYEVKFLN